MPSPLHEERDDGQAIEDANGGWQYGHRPLAQGKRLERVE